METNNTNVKAVYDLSDTADMMSSTDYKERFKAEYCQTKIRYTKLKSFINRIEAAQRAGTEEPKHDCPLDLLMDQQHYMERYLHILEVRAIIENIIL